MDNHLSVGSSSAAVQDSVERKPYVSRSHEERTGTGRKRGWWAVRWPLIKKDFHTSYLRLWEQPVLTWLTCSVIALSLALPLSLYLLVSQLVVFTEGWQAENQMMVYLNPSVELSEAQSMAARINGMSAVANVQLISKEQGLESFAQDESVGQVFSHFDTNPLPHVLVVIPNSMDETVLQPLLNRLNALMGVDSVQLDLQWLQKLNAILALGWRIVLTLAIGFAVAVLLVVYNTIRLALEHRIREIQILDQLGASGLFIARPYLLSGAFLGVIGGILALLLVQGAYYWLEHSIVELASFYAVSGDGSVDGAMDVVLGMSWPVGTGLVGIAVGLGFISAAIAVYFRLSRR